MERKLKNTSFTNDEMKQMNNIDRTLYPSNERIKNNQVTSFFCAMDFSRKKNNQNLLYLRQFTNNYVITIKI